METNEHELNLKEAELSRIQADTARINAEREKIEFETKEICAKNDQNWWNIRASGLIQSVIGGIVAGALVAGFGLDHFLKVADLNEKSQKALELEKSGLVKKTSELEEKTKYLELKQEENWQVITALRNENKNVKAQADAALENIVALSSSPSECNEGTLNREITSLETELQRVTSEAKSRGESLTNELEILVEEREATAKGNENNWFPVISSPYNTTDLLGKLEELARITVQYPVQVYKTADKRGVPVYAITLGGYLSKADAAKRVSYARSSGIAPDAYPWRSNIWGENIRAQVERK